VSEEQIRALLQRADEVAGTPAFGRVSTIRIRRRIQRRWVFRSAAIMSAAAVITIAATLGILCTRLARPQPQHAAIASLEAQVKQLQARTDATVQLIQEVLKKDRQQRHLASLEAELSSIPDPRLEIEQQVDKAAFILLYQADRLYKELNRTDSAVAAYKEIIQLFPTHRWAEVARERLAEIEKHRSSHSDTGESRWRT
jgi:tetratricopeptide (TPR) repeat protein